MSGRVILVDIAGLDDLSRVRVDLGRGEGGVTPDEDGTFEISDVEPDTYQLAVSYVGGLNAQASRSAYRVLRQRVVVRAGAAVNVGALEPVRASGTLRGRLQPPGGMLLQGAKLTLTVQQGDTRGLDSADGSFEFTDVPVGNHMLRAQSPGLVQAVTDGCQALASIAEEDELKDLGDVPMVRGEPTLLPGGDGVSAQSGLTWHVRTGREQLSVNIVAPYATLLRYGRADLDGNDAGSGEYSPWDGSAVVLDVPLGRSEWRFELADRCGYESPVERLVLIRDESAPVIDSVVINNGDASARVNPVRVVFTAGDELGGSLKMRVASCRVTSGAQTDCGGRLDAEPFATFERVKAIMLEETQGTYLVEAEVQDEAGNVSDPQHDTIDFDNVPPQQTSFTIDHGAALTRRTVVDLHLSAEGATLMRIAEHSGLGDVTPQPYVQQQQWSLSQGDGLKSIWVSFEDAAGNRSSEVDRSITLDTASPAAPVVTLGSGAGYSPALDVVFGAQSSESDTSGLMVEITGDIDVDELPMIVPYASVPATLRMRADGSWQVTVTLIDAAGNRSAAATRLVRVDTEDPVNQEPEIGNQKGYVVSSAGAVLKVPCNDTPSGSGVASKSYRITRLGGGGADAGSGGGWMTPPDVASAYVVDFLDGEGRYLVETRCTDRVGRVSNIGSREVSYDMAPPSIAVTLNPNNTSTVTNSPQAVLRVSSTPLGDITALAMSEQDLNCDPGVTSYIPGSGGDIVYLLSSTEGPKVVFVCAQDEAGNYTAVRVASNTILLDASRPAPPDVVLGNGSGLASSAEAPLGIATSEIDTSGLRVVIAGELEAGAGNFLFEQRPTSVRFPGGEGIRSLSVHLVDAAGNESTAVTRSVRLDINDPDNDSPVVGNGSGFVTDSGGNTTLEVRCGDAGSGLASKSYRFYRGATSTEPFITDTTLPALYGVQLTAGEGDYTVETQCTDRAGRTSRLQKAYFTWDATAPSITVQANPPPFRNPTRNPGILVRISGALSDIEDAAVSTQDLGDCASADYRPYVGDLLITLPADGDYTFYACARDAGGNYTTLRAASELITLDTAAPTGVSIQFASTLTNSRDIDVTLNASAFASEVLLSGSLEGGDVWLPQPWPTRVTLTDGDGPKTLTAIFRDEVGNSSMPVSAITVLDTQPPSGTATIFGKLADGVTESTIITARDTNLRVRVDSADPAAIHFTTDLTVDCGTVIEDAFENYAPDKILSTFNTAIASKRRIAVCIRDAANNRTRLLDEIDYDATPPNGGTVVINGGNGATDSRLVSVTVSGADNDVVEMFVQNDSSPVCGTAAPYLRYLPAQSWMISDGDSPPAKAVYVCLRDAAGNSSAAALSDTIDLDTSAPTDPRIVVGASLTRNPNLPVTLTATGATEVLLNGDIAELGTWFTTFPTTVSLTGGDGVKSISAIFRDAAGHMTTAATAAVVLDRTPPSGVATIYGKLKDGVTESTAITASDTNLRVRVDSSDGTWLYFSNVLTTDCASVAAGSFAPFSADTVISAFNSSDAAKRQIAICVRDGADNRTRILDDIAYDATPPAAGTLVINGGDAATANPLVSLALAGGPGDVMQMYIANDIAPVCASAGPYAPYQPAVNWGLSDGDGLAKAVYACLRDAAGNSSAVPLSDTIELDTSAPTNPRIVTASSLVKSTRVPVTLSATGATEVLLSGDISEAGTWYPTFPTAVTLTGDDGVKAVSAIFRDAVGHTTPAVTVAVLLDRVLPSGVVTINGKLRDGVTESTTITAIDTNLRVRVQSSDTTSLYFSSVLTTDCAAVAVGSFTPFAADTIISAFNTSDASKRQIAVCLRDSADNRTLVRDEIAFDGSQPAAGVVLINGGDATTASPFVSLTITGAPADALSMHVANDTAPVCASAGPYVPFQPALSWTLSDVDGAAKAVFVCLRDSAGNSSAAALTDTIELDTAAPTDPSIVASASLTKNPSLPITLSATDATEALLSGDVAEAGSWYSTFPTTVTLTGTDGVKTISAVFRDAAGHTTSPVTAAVFLDRAPPSGAVTIYGKLKDGVTESTSITATDTNLRVHVESGDTTWLHFSSVPTVDCAAVAAGSFTPFAADTVISAFNATDPAKRQIAVCLRDSADNRTRVLDDIPYDASVPSAGTLLINGGDVATANQVVALSIAGASADTTQMYVVNDAEPDCAVDGPYGPFQNALGWRLSDGDSPPAKRIYVCLRDAAGNSTAAAFFDDIALDTTPPTNPSLVPAVSITKNVSLQVTLSATGATEVLLSGDVAEAGTWFALFPTTLTLTGGDGVKAISAVFRDSAWHVTAAVTAAVVLDRAPPTGVVTINGKLKDGVTESTTITAVDTNLRVRVESADATSLYFSSVLTVDCALVAAASFSAFTSDTPISAFDSSVATSRQIAVCLRDGADNRTRLLDGIVYDATPPGAATLSINGGATATSDPLVSLSISGTASDVVSMHVANDTAPTCASASPYVPYQPAVSWTLSAGDDVSKAVFVCLRDAAGNSSAAAFSDTIELDTVSPTGASIVLATSLTNNTSVGVTLSAAGATRVLLSGDVSEAGTWLSTFPTSVTLTGSDGIKTISAIFRDNVWHTTSPVTAAVVLDTADPSGVVTINGKLKNGVTESTTITATDTNLRVRIDSADTSTVYFSTVLAVDCDAVAAGSFSPFSTDTVISAFNSSDPTKRQIAVCLRDGANNRVRVVDSIAYDATQPASGAVLINGDDAATANPLVSLEITGAASDVTEMYIANDTSPVCASASPFVPYQPAVSWTLSDGDGAAKAVFVCLRDAAGNSSAAAFNDTIELDTAVPTNPSIALGASPRKDPAVPVTLSANGATHVLLSGDVAEAGTWYSTFPTSVTLTGADGVKAVSAIFRDAVWHTTSVVTAAVVLDRARPSGTVAIFGKLKDGAESASISSTGTNLRVHVESSDAATMLFSTNLAVDCDAQPAGSFVPYAVDSTTSLFDNVSDPTKLQLAACLRDAADNRQRVIAGIPYDASAPGAATVRINGTDAFSTSALVALTVTGAASDVVAMYVRNDSPASPSCEDPAYRSLYEPFYASRSWYLSAGSESIAKEVFVCLRDSAGNAAQAGSDTITLDTVKPVISSFLVAGGEPYTTDYNAYSDALRVALASSYSDVNGVTSMRFEYCYSMSAPCLTSGDLTPSGSAVFNLAIVEGPITSATATSITDATKSWTSGQWVGRRVHVPALKATRTITANTASTLTFSPSLAGASGVYDIYAGEETATISMTVTDAAGNVSAPVSDSIIIDTIPPAMAATPLAITKYATTPAPGYVSSVALNVASNVGTSGGPVEMALANTKCTTSSCTPGSCTDAVLSAATWQPFALNSTFVVPSGDGTIRVCGKYRDAAGNPTTASDAYGDTAILDTTQPTAPRMATLPSITNAASVNVSLALAATDSSPISYQINGGVLFTAFPRAVTLVEGNNSIALRAVDAAGNRSAEDISVIVRDTTAPGLATLQARVSDGEVALTWPPPPANGPGGSNDVAYYRLHYGVTAGTYDGSFAAQGASPVNVGNVTNFTLSGLSNDMDFYVAIEAIDRAGNSGPLSAAVNVRPNPMTPVIIGSTSTSTWGLGAGAYGWCMDPGSIAARDGLVFVGVRGTLTGDNCTSTNYTGDNAGAVVVLAMHDPTNPVVIARYVSNTGFGRASSAHHTSSLVLHGDYLYVAAGEGGLLTFDIRSLGSAGSPATLTPTSVIAPQAPSISTIAVTARNNRLYIGGNDGTVRRYRLDNPSVPALVDSTNFGVWFYDIDAQGDYLYGATGSAGIRAMRVASDTWGAAQICAANRGGVSVKASGRYAYSVSGNFRICDAGTAASVSYTATSDISLAADEAVDLDIAGPYAYLATRYGLRVYDVSNPAQPRRVGREESWWGTAMAVDGALAYMGGTNSAGNLPAIKVYRLADPIRPTLRSQWTELPQTSRIAGSGTLLFEGLEWDAAAARASIDGPTTFATLGRYHRLGLEASRDQLVGMDGNSNEKYFYGLSVYSIQHNGVTADFGGSYQTASEINRVRGEWPHGMTYRWPYAYVSRDYYVDIVDVRTQAQVSRAYYDRFGYVRRCSTAFNPSCTLAALTGALTDNNTTTTSGSALQSWPTTDAFYVGLSSLFDGVYFDIATANGVLSTLSAEYWDGAQWTSLAIGDGTAAGGVTLKQNGEVTWTAPANWAPRAIGGSSSLFYVRLRASAVLSAGFVVNDVQPRTLARTYRTAGRTGWQPWGDDAVRKCTLAAASCVDLDTVLTDGLSATDSGTTLNALATTDALFLGVNLSATKFDGLYLGVGTANNVGATLVVEYWNGSFWSAVQGLVDGTTVGGVTLARSGFVRWLMPNNWATSTALGALPNGYYYVRVRSGTALGAATKISDVGFRVPDVYVNYSTGDNSPGISYFGTNLIRHNDLLYAVGDGLFVLRDSQTSPRRLLISGLDLDFTHAEIDCAAVFGQRVVLCHNRDASEGFEAVSLDDPTDPAPLGLLSGAGAPDVQNVLNTHHGYHTGHVTLSGNYFFTWGPGIDSDLRIMTVDWSVPSLALVSQYTGFSATPVDILPTGNVLHVGFTFVEMAVLTTQ